MGLRTWVAALVVSLAAAGAAQAADASKTAHVALSLAPQTVAAAPGSTLYVGLQEVIAPGWHTYWRNPGDSGEPTAITWTLPPGWSAGPIVWPAPGRVATGPLVNYVYADKVVLPTPVQVPASAPPGSTATLKAAVTYLVCKDVCIPEQASLDLAVPVASGAAKLDPALGQAITDTLAAAPKPAGLQAHFARSGDAVSLSVTGAQLKGADVGRAWFYPYDGQLLDHAKPQQVAGGPDGLTMTLPAGYGFTHGDAPKALDGVLALGGGKAWEVHATPGAPLPGSAGASPSRPSASTGDAADAAATMGGGAGAPHVATGAQRAAKLMLTIGAAFLGGLILNLMPCVFPVLSLKAAALARHAESPQHARAEGLGYLAGVVASFLVLAGVLIALRAAGQEVGWGFQLQSPAVTAALTLLMLLVALNLSGVFEVGTSVQGAGGGLARQGGVWGSVFTGVLAVVVAAPCSGPFMASAVGWALVQPPAAALAVFLGLGLGLGAPFVVVSFVPGALRWMPKPGAWMEGLRHVLAFPMYATAAFFAWVFAGQSGQQGLLLLFAGAVATAFAAWAWGVGQRQEKPWAPRVAALAGLAAAVPLVAFGASLDAAPSGGATPARVGRLEAQPWSPERVAQLTSQGKPVFVDFTAAWCITCQVNERGVLAGARVADAFRKTGAVYLKADWTKRDAKIARVLADNGREGVPLYLVYAPGRETPQVLPQLLSEGAVAAALEAAGRKA